MVKYIHEEGALIKYSNEFKEEAINFILRAVVYRNSLIDKEFL